MTDPQLAARNGLNVGVEPSGFLVDKGLQNKFLVQNGSEVAVLQHSPNNNRLVVGKKKEGFYIYAFNKSLTDDFTFAAFWENSFGERIDLDPAYNTVAAGDTGLQLIGFNKFGFGGVSNAEGYMTLAPGEKIIIKGTQGSGTFFIPTYDVKRKPKPSGGGGLTDGNVVTVRGNITPAGIDFQPPPGKAWAALPSVGIAGRLSTKVGHFGALSDTQADVAQYLVDGDGVEYFMAKISQENGGNPVLPQTFQMIGVNNFGSFPNVQGGFWGSTSGLLAYPNKYRIKLIKWDDGEDPPFAFPAGRIQFLGTFQEFDLPADAQL